MTNNEVSQRERRVGLLAMESVTNTTVKLINGSSL